MTNRIFSLGRTALALLLLGTAGTLSACGGGDGTGPEEDFPVELTGRWEAGPSCVAQGCAFTVYDPGAPSDSLNLATALSISMLVQTTGRVILTVPGYGSTEGDARVSGNRLYVAGTAGTDTATWALTGGTLRLDFTSRFEGLFDLDGDQVPDAVRARAVFFKDD